MTPTEIDFGEVRNLDWSDLACVQRASATFLRQLACHPNLLDALIRKARDDPNLYSLCEHYDILDKIVLHDDPTGFRLRLHIFGPGYFDRPHNHRWAYTSLILRGSYLHSIYAIQETDSTLAAPTLSPAMARVENEGDCYTLDTNVAHSITAQPYTTTLILRGPATSDRFFVTDRTTGTTWYQFGAQYETLEQRAAKAMSRERFNELETYLRDAFIIQP